MGFDFTQASQGFIDPFVIFWNSVVGSIPGIIGALIVLSLGYFIGTFVGFALGKAVARLKIDAWLEDRQDIGAEHEGNVALCGACLARDNRRSAIQGFKYMCRLAQERLALGRQDKLVRTVMEQADAKLPLQFLDLG